MRGRLLALQAFWSYDRMQSLGLLFALDPCLKGANPDPARYREALLRHMGFFNTNPIMAGYAAGALAGLEEELARRSGPGRAELEDKVERTRRSLGSALAAIGDTFFWGTLRPAAAAVAGLAGLLAWRAAGAGWAAAAAACAYLAAFNAPAVGTRARAVSVGRAAGDRLVEELAAMRWHERTRWTARAGLLACAAACAVAIASAPWPSRGPAWEAGTLAACAALRAFVSAPAAYAALAAAGCAVAAVS